MGCQTEGKRRTIEDFRFLILCSLEQEFGISKKTIEKKAGRVDCGEPVRLGLSLQGRREILEMLANEYSVKFDNSHGNLPDNIEGLAEYCMKLYPPQTN